MFLFQIEVNPPSSQSEYYRKTRRNFWLEGTLLQKFCSLLFLTFNRKSETFGNDRAFFHQKKAEELAYYC
jgi:hypothetical protein